MRQIHADSGGAYGSARVTAELRRRGRRVNHKRVCRLMRHHGICGIHKRRRPRWRRDSAAQQAPPDLVRRRFGPGRPDSVWAGDITYIPSGEGWLYLAAVLDIGSRRLIGYSMAADMPARLVIDALDTAAASRGPQHHRGDIPLGSRSAVSQRRLLGCAGAPPDAPVSRPGGELLGATASPSRFSPPSNESSSTSAASRHATKPAARSSPGSPATTPSASTQHSTTKPRQNGSNTTHDNDYTKPHKQCVQPTGGSPCLGFWGWSGARLLGVLSIEVVNW